MWQRKRIFLIAAVAFFGIVGPQLVGPGGQNADWSYYGGSTGAEGNRFSTLTQINTANVTRLKEAWRYAGGGGYETHPMIVDGKVFGYGDGGAFALDGSTGEPIWTYPGASSSRGFAYWKSEGEKRLFVSETPFVTALDPDTGIVIRTFGRNGRIDLRKGLTPGDPSLDLRPSTPGSIYKDLYITGFYTAEAEPAYPGDIRAFDVRTGKLVWTFHTIPRKGEFGAETWPAGGRTTGAANNWAGMAVDAERGIVYAPTGSAVNDFYGANRVGANPFANTLLAIDAKTGKRLWHFQAVHHDTLDRDFASPPSLATVQHNGQMVDIVAQPSKQGWLYVFNRVTGEPLWPIEEREVPSSLTLGEVSSRTQPFVTKPAPFARQRLTEDLLTDISPNDHDAALQQFRTFLNNGPFTPLALDRNTVVFPGFDGGAEWGGEAIDPRTGVMYINANDLAYFSMLRANPETTGRGAGTGGGHSSGAPPVEGAKVDLQPPAPAPAPYVFSGYNRWMINGHPGVAPPWGTLNAIDLNTGEYLWRIPLGEYPDLVARGIRNTGSENYGGPIVTAGGLVFIGATIEDRKFRAFDAKTGKLLWETTLPGIGRSTPATYMINGKQYVVITVTGAASFMIAFSL